MEEWTSEHFNWCLEILLNLLFINKFLECLFNLEFSMEWKLCPVGFLCWREEEDEKKMKFSLYFVTLRYLFRLHFLYSYLLCSILKMKSRDFLGDFKNIFTSKAKESKVIRQISELFNVAKVKQLAKLIIILIKLRSLYICCNVHM